MNGAGKDLRALARELQRQGWRRQQAKRSSHIIMTPPDGGRPLVLSNTPGSRGALLKAKVDLRRMGNAGNRR